MMTNNNMEVKQCRKCGNIMQGNSMFCTQCGSPMGQGNENIGMTNNYVNTNNSEYNSNICYEAAAVPIMVLEKMALHKGKQPEGDLLIYQDRVEFVRSGENFASSVMFGGLFGVLGVLIGGLISACKKPKTTGQVDCFFIGDIAIANKSKHPKVSSYIEIVMKNGNKFKYLDRAGSHKTEELFAAVDVINRQLEYGV